MYYRENARSSTTTPRQFRLLVYSLSYFIVAGFLLEIDTVPPFRLYELSYIHLFLHHLWVYYELATRPVPSWLDSSVGRVLRRYHRAHEF